MSILISYLFERLFAQYRVITALIPFLLINFSYSADFSLIYKTWKFFFNLLVFFLFAKQK